MRPTPKSVKIAIYGWALGISSIIGGMAFALTRSCRPGIRFCRCAFRRRAHGSRAAEAAPTPDF